VTLRRLWAVTSPDRNAFGPWLRVPRGNDWLEDDLKRLSNEGIGVLVSMSTPEEAAELGLSKEGRFCDQCGISFFNLLIADRYVPYEFEIVALLDAVVKQVQLGRGVGFH
jgi:hypothetical protein